MVKPLLALALLTLATASAQAQASAPRTVTLQEVIARARQNPPAVLAALATLERTRAEEERAHGAYYPTVQLQSQAGLNYTNQPYLPGLRYKPTALSVDGSATVDMPLYDARRAANVGAAEASVKAQEAAARDAERRAIAGAVGLYFDAVAARARIADAQLTLDRRSTQYDKIAGLAASGVRAKVDEQRAKIEVVSAEAFVRLREVEQQATQSALAAALGDDPLAPLQPAEGTAAGFEDVPAPDEAVKRAEEHRPELRQAEATLRAARERERAARAARLPTIGVAATGSARYLEIVKRSGLEGAFLNAQAGVYLRWAAVDVTAWRGVDVAGAQVTEAQRQLDVARLTVRNDVVAAAFGAQRARVALERAEQVLAAAEVTRKSQNERFASGIATLLELLDAEEQEQNARLGRINAQRDYDAARAQLAAATGVIDG